MKRYNEEDNREREKFENRLIDAVLRGTADDVRNILKEGFEIDPNDLMIKIMWHCTDIEHVKILKEAGYNFKDDQRALEEFTKHAALKPEIAQFILDNGAVVSWRAIQNCANRYALDVLKILVNAKKDFFPID